MKKIIKYRPYFLAVLAVLAVMLTIAVFAAPAKWDYYEGSVDGASHGEYITWMSQTFTANVTYNASKITLPIYRLGSPGQVTYSLKNTVGGLPSGVDLVTGSINGNTLPTVGTWTDLSFSTNTSLTIGTKYAICLRAYLGNATNTVYWQYDGTAPTYTGGGVQISTDNGSSWTDYAGYDRNFQVWGFGDKPNGVTSFSAIANSDNTVTLSWTMSANATSVYLVRSYYNYPANYSSYTLIYNGAAANYTDIGLVNYLDKYYRIWEWNPSGYSINFSQLIIQGVTMSVSFADTQYVALFVSGALAFGFLVASMFIKKSFIYVCGFLGWCSVIYTAAKSGIDYQGFIQAVAVVAALWNVLAMFISSKRGNLV